MSIMSALLFLVALSFMPGHVQASDYILFTGYAGVPGNDLRCNFTSQASIQSYCDNTPECQGYSFDMGLWWCGKTTLDKGSSGVGKQWYQKESSSVASLYAFVANEGSAGICFGTVKYGTLGVFVTKESAGAFNCTNPFLGDPTPNKRKTCSCRPGTFRTWAVGADNILHVTLTVDDAAITPPTLTYYDNLWWQKTFTAAVNAIPVFQVTETVVGTPTAFVASSSDGIVSSAAGWQCSSTSDFASPTTPTVLGAYGVAPWGILQTMGAAKISSNAQWVSCGTLTNFYIRQTLRTWAVGADNILAVTTTRNGVAITPPTLVHPAELQYVKSFTIPQELVTGFKVTETVVGTPTAFVASSSDGIVSSAAGWQCSTSWSYATTTTPTVLGAYGVAPWGVLSGSVQISSNAQWLTCGTLTSFWIRRTPAGFGLEEVVASGAVSESAKLHAASGVLVIVALVALIVGVAVHRRRHSVHTECGLLEAEVAL